MTWHRTRASHDHRVWQDRLPEGFTGPTRFRKSLLEGSHVSVIGEVKRRSPSKGPLRDDLDVAQITNTYAEAGAAALSILTDSEFFGGSPDDLTTARQHTDLPILRKDFTITANDVIDAFEWGADAVLLIVAVLSDEELRHLLDVSERCGLDALVEVHDEIEARRALDLGSTLVGVNQRDLRTFEVDRQRAERVVTQLPNDVARVCESGLQHDADIERASAAGFDAVLVGESLIRSDNPSELLRGFSSHPRRRVSS